VNNFTLKSIEEDRAQISNFYKIVGTNVKKIRKQRGVTQIDLAHAIGFKTVSSIAKPEILCDNKHFNLEHLYKISKVLEVDICEFFKDDETEIKNIQSEDFTPRS